MERNGTDQPLLEIVLQFFRDAGWNYQKMAGESVYRTGYRGEHGTWVCYARIDEENRRFLFYSVMGFHIPPDYRCLVSEYLTRVNYTLCIGNFEMDMDSGDVRFRTGIEIPQQGFSPEMVRSLASINVNTMDHYFPGVIAVVNSGLSPEAALARLSAQAEESIFGR